MENNNVNLKVKCGQCGKTYTIRVNLDDLNDWQSGDKLVQNAFPYLSAEERELLLTKICPDCWNKMFGQYDF